VPKQFIYCTALKLGT